MSNLIDEAYNLHDRINNATYRYAMRYALYPSYRPDSETDPVLARANRILGRSEARIQRRIQKQRRTQ